MSAPKAENGFVHENNCVVASGATTHSAKNPCKLNEMIFDGRAQAQSAAGENK
jgi:hypothetical protein